MGELVLEQRRLLAASRAANTHNTYEKAWKAFQRFRLQYSYNIYAHPNIEEIAQFIAYLSWHGYASSTISTYVSGIAFIIKSNGLPDITDNFVIRRLIDGCKRRHARRDTRCPITLPILKALLASLSHVCSHGYEVAMFRSAYLLAFFGFLRVSEFTVSTRHSPITLFDEDVYVSEGGTTRQIHIRIRRSKTDQAANGCQITLPANDRYEICPVRAVANYRSMRSRGGIAFFCNFDRTPLTRQQFTSTLKRAVAFCGLPVTFYSSHSFRIGAATSAAMSGVPEVRIQSMGRWSTDTHKIYIRPTLSFPHISN